MGVPNFSIFLPLALCGPIWMIFGGPETQHGELFPHRRTFFVWQKKNPNSQPKVIFVNSELFFCPKKKSYGGKKVRHVGFQVHQKSSKSARIRSGKKTRVSLVCFCLYRECDATRKTRPPNSTHALERTYHLIPERTTARACVVARPSVRPPAHPPARPPVRPSVRPSARVWGGATRARPCWVRRRHHRRRPRCRRHSYRRRHRLGR